jgi:5-formyltetrahydrofolate cyclo-ligase
MKQKRDLLSDDAIAQKSAKITSRLLKHDVYQQAKRIFCYVSTGSEVETEHLLQQIIDDKGSVWVPRVVKDHQMIAVAVNALASLKPGRYGILEPTEGEYDDDLDCDLVICPGLAFDSKGGRLGSGRGYYDHFLSKHVTARIGLAFEIQFIREAPMDVSDCYMEYIITEELSYYTGK